MQALPVFAAGPAAGPPLACFEIFAAPGHPLFARLGFLGGRDPADPLVAGQRGDVAPRRERGFVVAQGVGQVRRQRVDGTAFERVGWPRFWPGLILVALILAAFMSVSLPAQWPRVDPVRERPQCRRTGGGYRRAAFSCTPPAHFLLHAFAMTE